MSNIKPADSAVMNLMGAPSSAQLNNKLTPTVKTVINVQWIKG